MGQADHTGHHVLAGLHLDLQGAGTRTYAHALAILQLPLLQVLRVHQQLMPWLAFHQTMEVVHPRVVAAHMAPPDQQQLARHRGRHLRQAVQVVQQNLGGSFDCLAGSRQTTSEVAA
ncbi:hypothetical protein D3C80_1142660 [compost metagenome]